MSTVHLHAAETHPEWAPPPIPELRLWSTDLVILHGSVADIRALLVRALELIPPTTPLKGDDQ